MEIERKCRINNYIWKKNVKEKGEEIMKKKLICSMLAGVMAMMFITGCGEKEESGKNLITSTEDEEMVPTESVEATPTEAEATPTESLEATSTESVEITPTETPEATPTTAPTATPEITPTQVPTVTPTSAPVGVTKEEAEQLLVGTYGLEDESTGNINGFSYESTVTIDGVQYYNFRWSSQVNGHMTYLTNLAVATDGSAIYEVISDENGNLKLVK